MDVKQLAQNTVDIFNDRSFREKAEEVANTNIVVTDKPTAQEFRGVDGFVQFSEGFITAMPDIKGTVLEQTAEGNRATTRVRGQGTFTGTLQTPQGNVQGNGNPVDIEYQLNQVFNEEGKLVHFTVDYDMQDFMRQLGLS
ncbi:MAG TPA: ester cyclase [Anaerolineales bacterium]|nr:ester cyclase [Anaerolineales bacterium]